MIASPDLATFATGLFASAMLIVPIRRLALHYGVVDRPGPRKVHAKPVPLLGGIAIYAGFVLAICLGFAGEFQHETAGILAGGTLLAVVGLLDDRGLLHHQVKLFLAMPLAALFLLLSGSRARLCSEWIPGPAGFILDGCFTLFWVVGVTASFSILDHLDGLCAGVAAVAAAFFTAAAMLNGQTIVQTLGAAAFGAALGFLLWNFNPAKIFMGDGGAMLLGFLMATLGLKVHLERVRSPLSWLVPILILGVPILDTTLISISRSRRGLLPFTSPGKDHTAHRLSNLGLGHRGAVVTMYGAAIVFGSAALAIPYLATGIVLALVLTLAIFAAAAIWRLESAPYERQSKKPKSSSAGAAGAVRAMQQL
jgi:UDP-GlcNAc:undecaprenyl-phosphate/decaprenyl-phosphate GlcNAc-1-phosphate transferase